jgi:hypothetical protein
MLERAGRSGVVAVAATVTVLAGVAVAVRVAADRFSDLSIAAGPDRTHLDPIPIDRADACPRVEAVHSEAQRFVELFGGGFLPGAGMFAGDDWPARQIQLDEAMARLDFATAAAMPALPTRVQTELEAVRRLLAEGRLRLAAASGPDALLGDAVRLYAEGQQHLGWAGDLVGSQCGISLAV